MKIFSMKECIEAGIIKEVPEDIQRTKSLVNLAILRQEFWEQKHARKFSVLKIEAYYEIIKELAFALMYKEGFSSSNHLCMLAFLNDTFIHNEYEIRKVSELCRVRSDINYRGVQVPQSYLEQNEMEFKHTINLLQGRIKEIN
tara:strand:+ start:1938 stop:2366 length:429 start_codon:yes stop_codon:yes gene_type:complete